MPPTLRHWPRSRRWSEDDPDARLEEFKAHFGDLRSVERDFLQKMSRVE